MTDQELPGQEALVTLAELGGATVTDYPPMPRGTCFQSSRLMAAMHPELRYAEGVLVIRVGEAETRIAHAWNVHRETGEVVDTTRDTRYDTATYSYEEHGRGTTDG